jgi:hypothetical protein
MFKRAVSKSTRPFWTPAGRTVVFLLAASSIGCLLGEFYQPDSMRVLALFVFLPAVAVLLALAAVDGFWGDRRLLRGVTTGFAAGFVAAVAYDLFRLPFVFAEQWGIDAIVPPLNLFKVFPAFGALILGHAAGQTGYTLADHITGWAYHFSNGMSFGVMFTALLGEVARRRWVWGVAMAAGLEAGMLLTPYPRVFGIAMTSTFVVVTLAAHSIFGVVMGLSAQRLSSAWRLDRL